MNEIVNEHMSGEDIAKELGLTRARVSQILKTGIKKSIKKLRYKYTDYSMMEIITTMAYVFNIKTDSEYRKFFKLLPKNIRGEIYAEAEKIGYI